MGKSALTIEIEEKLKERFIRGNERYAFEVPIKGGIVDAVTSELNYINHNIPHIVCYEIKVSFADFKSENGHNFYGEENYYVIPQKLLDEIIKKGENGRFHDIGIIVYKDGKLRKKSNGNRIYYTLKKLNIEDKFNLLDNMLMRVLGTGK